MDMGFTRSHCVCALTNTSSLEQATEYILTHPPPTDGTPDTPTSTPIGTSESTTPNPESASTGGATTEQDAEETAAGETDTPTTVSLENGIISFG